MYNHQPRHVFAGGGARQIELAGKTTVRVGVFCTIAQKESCSFQELMRTPMCCAVAKGHRLAGMKELTLADLNGEYLVMPIAGVSAENGIDYLIRKNSSPGFLSLYSRI